MSMNGVFCLSHESIIVCVVNVISVACPHLLGNIWFLSVVTQGTDPDGHNNTVACSLYRNCEQEGHQLLHQRGWFCAYQKYQARLFYFMVYRHFWAVFNVRIRNKIKNKIQLLSDLQLQSMRLSSKRKPIFTHTEKLTIQSDRELNSGHFDTK